jgi:hypothetical protein
MSSARQVCPPSHHESPKSIVGSSRPSRATRAGGVSFGGMPGSLKVYVKIVDDAVDVWRPVAARKVRAGVYQLVGETPDGETWEFPTGKMVRCRLSTLEDGKTGLVAYERA